MDLGHDPRQNLFYYPQSNGKIEQWHKSLKGDCLRPGTLLSLDARRLVEGYVEHYNNVRLNSAVSYITPKDMLAGRHLEIQAETYRKSEEARKQRQVKAIRAELWKARERKDSLLLAYAIHAENHGR